MEHDILLVEDSRTQAAHIRHVLEARGYRVRWAETGRQALAMARERVPDLVVSDVMMPEMNGYVLCSALKADRALASVPVLLLTSMGDPGDVMDGLACGADYFLVKPFDETLFLNRVGQAIRDRGKVSDEPPDEPLSVEHDGSRYVISASRKRIIDLLLSTYEAAVHRNNELVKAQEALRLLNEQLEQRVRSRTDALLSEVRERQRAEETVRLLNDELERRVRDRTAQLQAAVDELEAFSYSVSHDLRAPLRSINGFSNLLLEECGPELAAEHARYLHVVADSARHMARLIDDLLTSSRVNRHPLQRQRVPMRALVGDILEVMRPEYEGRNVEIEVGDLPVAEGDPVLVREVLTNLLSNAFKFTRQRDPARVEVGAESDGEKTVYFVRDNGVGFDMAYADKLFGVFQRLHHASDYEGTGVGLSIVQRVVQRHGGRVWAQAEVGGGATFYFHL